jgi:hypothetical protein
MVPRGGIEPPTLRFSVSRSTLSQFFFIGEGLN